MARFRVRQGKIGTVTAARRNIEATTKYRGSHPDLLDLWGGAFDPTA
jgi:hypothetical protein